MLARLALCAFVALPALAQAGNGGVRGVVIDHALQIPLPEAEVTLAELGRTSTTDEAGAFAFADVRPGRYTLLAEKTGYDPIGVPGIPVGPGKATERRIELFSQAVLQEETEVVAPSYKEDNEVGILEERKQATTVQDAVSSEVFSKAGAGDAAGALKMVVGTSVAAGKYVSVRGLSDRYTGTTVNGVRVPSADPRRRAVQVDLFPTGTIESVTVTKTFTPDLQGDFTGGGVDIKTRSIPGKVLSVGLTSEFNSVATFNDNFLTYREGGVRATGFGAADRALPGTAKEPLPGLPSFPAFSRPTGEQMAASQAYDGLTRAFSPVMGISRSAPGLNRGLSLVAGNWFQVGGKGVLGAMGSLTYASKFDQYTLGKNNSAGVSDPQGGIGISRARKDSRGTEELLMGLLGNVVYQPSERHEISLRVLGTQSDEDEARYQAESAGGTTIEQNQTLHYTERDLLSNQLHGVHRLGRVSSGEGWEIDWTAALNRTDQKEPDTRFFRNSFDLATFGATRPSNSTEAQNTRRIFRTIDEDNTQGQLDVKRSFVRFGDREAFVKAGLYREGTDRGYDQHSFTYLFPTQGGSFIDPARRANLALSGFTGDSAYDLWTDVFLSPDRIGLAGTAPAGNQLLWVLVPVGNDVNYTGEQQVGAAYVMGSLPLLRRLDLIAGARYERTEIAVDPRTLSGSVERIVDNGNGNRSLESVAQEAASTRLYGSDVLPSLSLVWKPRDGMNVRGSWSRTLARPTFRELAPVATEEFIFGDEYFGNPDLKLSTITNYDLRWEWFRRPGEVLAASLFEKRIEDPIELISFSTANRTFVQPVNDEKGQAHGVEIEARTGLDLLGRFFSRLSVGANLTYIDSEVDLPASERASLAAFGLAEPTRRLQGQPEAVANLSLVYDNDDSGTSIGVFYNLTGETLVSGAGRGQTDGTPDVYEKAYGSLDLSMSQLFLKNLTVTLRARNLLTPARRSVFRTPDGEEAVKTERDTPMLIGLGVGMKW